MTGGPVAKRRKTVARVVVASIALFGVGLVVDGLPSEDTHDRYWMLFVAPSAVAFIVGTIAWRSRPGRWLPRAHPPGGR